MRELMKGQIREKPRTEQGVGSGKGRGRVKGKGRGRGLGGGGDKKGGNRKGSLGGCSCPVQACDTARRGKSRRRVTWRIPQLVKL